MNKSIQRISAKTFNQKHLRIVFICLIGSVIFALIRKLAGSEKNFFGIIAIFFTYIFSLLEIVLFVWSKIVVNKLNKTVEINIFKTILIIVLFYFSTLVAALIIIFIQLLIVYNMIGAVRDNFMYDLLNHEMLPALIINVFLLLIGTIILLFYQWVSIIKQKQQEKEEKLVYQYQTLKEQLNPHFLFNSLNVLSSIIQSQPTLAETFVYKLSSIYRYVLSCKQIDLIGLDKEIKFAQEYFYLNKIRDEDKIELDIQFNFTETYQIIPISLQILIENALNHNSATRDKPLKIKIWQNANAIMVSNNLQRKSKLVESTRIGLQNLNERLKLLTGKELIIEETQSDYTVTIPLKPL